jgi:hypothetical protein
MRIAAGILAAAATAVLAVGASALPARADSTLTVKYPVSGTTHLATLGVDVPLGPGSLTAVVDTTTNTLTANLSLPAATATAKILGISVSATANFIQQGQATGTVNFANNTVSTTANETIQVTSISIAGITISLGQHCQTINPSTITVNSAAGFSVIFGGHLTGTYDIGHFEGCGLVDAVLDLTLSGKGNTIDLTLGGVTIL